MGNPFLQRFVWCLYFTRLEFQNWVFLDLLRKYFGLWSQWLVRFLWLFFNIESELFITCSNNSPGEFKFLNGFGGWLPLDFISVDHKRFLTLINAKTSFFNIWICLLCMTRFNSYLFHFAWFWTPILFVCRITGTCIIVQDRCLELLWLLFNLNVLLLLNWSCYIVKELREEFILICFVHKLAHQMYWVLHMFLKNLLFLFLLHCLVKLVAHSWQSHYCIKYL